MIIIKKKNSAFIISRNTCKKLAEHRLRNQWSRLIISFNEIRAKQSRRETKREGRKPREHFTPITGNQSAKARLFA